MKHISVSKVVLDYNLYPRHEVQSYNVNLIAEALNSGTVLPPIIIDRKSKRVIDGFHRVKAYEKLYGEHAKIPCVEKDYASEKEMFAEAIEANSKHGRNLSLYDRARCLARAEELKMDISVVAHALNMTIETLGKLKAERLGYFQSTPIVLKRTTAHLAGGHLTREQVAYNEQAGGMPASFFINQLISMIESDSVNWDDENVTRGFKRLYELLDKALA